MFLCAAEIRQLAGIARQLLTRDGALKNAKQSTSFPIPLGQCTTRERLNALESRERIFGKVEVKVASIATNAIIGPRALLEWVPLL